MATSANGYTVVESYPDARLHKWTLKLNGEDRHFVLRNGPTGFLLAHFALWFHEKIEPLNREETWDDWAYAVRNIRGSSTFISNHSSGTATDLNATKHPMGVRGTFSKAWQYTKIRAKLLTYGGALRWGGDYTDRPDEMHVEINKGQEKVARVARRIRKTARGQRVLAWNPRSER